MSAKPTKHIKSGARILALDDSPFSKTSKRALILGALGRMGVVEGALAFYVTIDGSDATDNTINAVKRSRFYNEIRLIATQSILFAGLNIVNIVRIEKETHIPVVALTRKKPHISALVKAMSAAKVGDIEKRLEELRQIENETSMAHVEDFYVHYTRNVEKEYITKHIDEIASLIRLAHIFAGAIVKGESRGRP